MKILIVGGGIAGLTAATLLQRQGNDILIVDTAPEYRHIGFGIYLWNFGRQVLDELGIAHKILSKAHMVPGTAFQNTHYETLLYIDYRNHGRYRPVSVYRADLHLALRDAAANVPVRFNTTFTSLDQDAEGATVQFSDGTMDRFDLVVGADGVHSKVRATVFENPRLRPYGWRSYAFWADSWENEEVQIISAPGCALAIVPLHDRHFAGINAFCEAGAPDPIETRLARLHAYTRAFDQSTHDFIDSLNPADIFYSDLLYVPMGPWATGRIALIGDARHAMSPVTGRGANIALEDGSALAKALQGVQSQEIPAALHRFNAERTRRVDRLRKQLHNGTDRFVLVRPSMQPVLGQIFKMLPAALMNRVKPDPSST